MLPMMQCDQISSRKYAAQQIHTLTIIVKSHCLPVIPIVLLWRDDNILILHKSGLCESI